MSLDLVSNQEFYIQTFLECEGNLPLAVEKAKTTRANFLFVLSKDPTALKSALHTLLLVNLASTLPRLTSVFNDLMQNLEPADAARTYSSIANIIAHISTPTAPSAPQINQYNLGQFNLTPEIREALTLLAPSGLVAGES